MSLLCEVKHFKEALKIASHLLEERELRQRGIDRISNGVILCHKFLTSLCQKNFNSYEELLKLLQTFDETREVIQLTGSLGKLLDVIQVLKPNTSRNARVKEAITKSLERTGHKYLLEELSQGQRRNYEKELIDGTGIFHLLEIVSLFEPTQSENPIDTFRNSMGARLPEEYFADLLAGWVVEDVFKNFFLGKGFESTLEGPDKEHKLLFVRPKKMRSYDFKIVKNDRVFYLELQRLAKLSKKRTKNKGVLCGKIKTYLKQHKYEGGNAKNKVLVLWVGSPSQNIYQKWSQKILFISNIKHKNGINFKDDRIYIPESFFDTALTWENLKQKSDGEILKFLESL